VNSGLEASVRISFLLVRASFLLVMLAVSGCRPAAGADAGPATDAGDSDGAVPPGTNEAIVATVEVVSAAMALGAPLATDGAALRDDSTAARPGDARNTAAQTRVEDGVSGHSIVTDPMCVAFAWDFASEPISVTVTFSSCTLEASGESLDGAITIGVRFGPTELVMSFDALHIGLLSFDGSVSVRLGGRCGPDTGGGCVVCGDADPACMATQANQQTLVANVMVETGGVFTITLDETTLTTDATGTTLSGGGSITSGSYSGDFTLNDTFIAMGDCLPSMGSVDLDDGGGLMVTYTFLATSPTDGSVYVQVNGFPSLTPPPPTVPVFSACP